MQPQYKRAPMSAQRSDNVANYTLSKEQKAIFQQFDKVAAAMRANGTQPSVVYVTRTQYMSINDAVARQSHGIHTLQSVRYNGFPIKHS